MKKNGLISAWTEEENQRMMHGGLLPPSAPVRQMVIGAPCVIKNETSAVLQSKITVGSVEKTVEFSVSHQYGDYLCYERADAFLIGLLNWAMRERCDIICEAPVTEELLSQINRELVPALVKYSGKLYAPRITARTENGELPCAGAVGTGCSLGVDSLHAIRSLTSDEYPGLKLTHLLINNVGAYTFHNKTNYGRYEFQVENARRFAKEFGYELIVTDSNFAEAFPQEHIKTHLYSSLFGIYALRKLWKVYFYASSGCDMEEYFNLSHNEEYDTSCYEMFGFPCLSIPQLNVRMESAHLERFEKLRTLAEYEPSHRYLNVCTNTGRNCGRCPKCRRTLWALEALGVLDKYRDVFDVDAYLSEGQARFYELYWRHKHGVHLLQESYTILRPKMRSALRMKLYYWKEALKGNRPTM